MQMTWKNDGGLWTVILGWLKLNWPTIYGAVLAVLIAYARIIYDGVNRKNRWLEALLCGALALTINGFLEGVGLPSSLTPFAGEMVGFIGVDKLREIAIKFLNTKATRRGDNYYDDQQ